MDTVEALTELTKLAPAVAVLLYLFYFFVGGKIVSKQLLDETRVGHAAELARMQADHTEEIRRLEEAFKTKEAALLDANSALLKERATVITQLEGRLKDRDAVAALGLQFMITSQRSQDNAAGLASRIEQMLNAKESPPTVAEG